MKNLAQSLIENFNLLPITINKTYIVGNMKDGNVEIEKKDNKKLEIHREVSKKLER